MAGSHFSCASHGFAARFSHRAEAAWTELFPRQHENSPASASAWLSIAVPTRGSPAPPLITCSDIPPNENHSHTITQPLHPQTQPPCRAPSRSKAARATLPHRESSSSHHHHNHGRTTRLIVCFIACYSLHRASTAVLFTLLHSQFATSNQLRHQHHGYAPYTDDR